MDIQHIQYFLEVVNQQSFSRAAESLYVTQPILSRCVKNLEEELSVKLILRTPKSFALTDAGKVLAEHGRLLVEQYKDLYRRIEDVKEVKSGEVSLSCPGNLLDIYFPPIVMEFNNRYPLVKINIIEQGLRPVVQDVLEGRADIGIVTLPIEDTENLQVIPIIWDEVCVLVNKDHPFAKQEQIDFKLLKNEKIITYNENTSIYNRFLEMCKQQNITPNIVYRSIMTNFILEMVSKSDCVGILADPVARSFHAENLCSIPLNPRFPWEIAMITRKDRYLTKASLTFLSFIEQEFDHRGRLKSVPSLPHPTL